LFFNQLEDKQLHKAFKIIKDAAILTVSDMSHFIREGGMIEFFKQRNKVKIGINPEALQAVDLKARAQLLNLSEIKTP
ncbi:MAG: YfiR family protein, partial [Pseudomonadota bacterium]|nr:YfiR family protein [Pseudomonadota bacterium]